MRAAPALNRDGMVAQSEENLIDGWDESGYNAADDQATAIPAEEEDFSETSTLEALDVRSDDGDMTDNEDAD